MHNKKRLHMTNPACNDQWSCMAGSHHTAWASARSFQAFAAARER